jgi:hypothetical protein
MLLTAQEDTLRSNLLTATEGALDLIATQYNTTRQQGSVASGNVLAINLASGLVIPTGTVLVNPLNGVTYQLSSEVNLPSNVEARVGVVAEDVGQVGNLNAGASLVSADYPNVLFTVGDFRTSSGKYCGQVAGGRDTQSDEELRSLLVSTMYSPKVGTDALLVNTLLDDPFVTKVWTQKVFPAVYTFWVDSSFTLTTAQLESLYNSLLPIAPAGLLYNVAQVTIKPISLHITFNSTILPDVVDTIKTIIQSYLNQIATNRIFNLSELTNYIKTFINIEFTIEVSGVTPDSAYGNILQLNDLIITYNI